MPEFFIVGHPKCGTTALYEMLSRHPRVFMPKVKETWYFSPELRSPRRRRRRKNPGKPDTIEDYLSLFDPARSGQRVGESSPAYLMSKTAAGRIARAQPRARIVAILREPAAFLRSFHMQALRDHVETEKDFGKAISLETARRKGRCIPRYCLRPHALLYSNHVRYVEQLRRYHAQFGRERVLVLIYEEFRKDNEEAVHRILDFLNVQDDAPIEPVKANPSRTVRSPRMAELLRSVYKGRTPAAHGAGVAIKAVTSRHLRRAALGQIRHRLILGEPEPPDEDVLLDLRRRFRPEVEALSEYLGRDLVAQWGYDRLA